MSDATTIRLTDKDREHIAAIIESGAATTHSDAIRIALWALANKIVSTPRRRRQ